MNWFNAGFGATMGVFCAIGLLLFLAENEELIGKIFLTALGLLLAWWLFTCHRDGFWATVCIVGVAILGSKLEAYEKKHYPNWRLDLTWKQKFIAWCGMMTVVSAFMVLVSMYLLS